MPNLVKMATRSLNPDDFGNKRTVTLKEYNRIQADHIMKHKWYLSEDRGYEVSFNEACKDWISSQLAVEFRKFFKVETRQNH